MYPRFRPDNIFQKSPQPWAETRLMDSIPNPMNRGYYLRNLYGVQFRLVMIANVPTELLLQYEVGRGSTEYMYL